MNLCWLAPWINALSTETDWNPGGQWRPMADADLLYRRALAGQKAFGFLMNTDFTRWPFALSERYMQRCLAYGMFPSFFSADAITNRYFDQPALYNRDRPLFKKYIPLIKIIAEAGWQPLTNATSSDPAVYVERFGSDYFTVFNDSSTSRTVTLTFDDEYASFKDLVSGNTLTVVDGILSLTLGAFNVALLDVQ